MRIHAYFIGDDGHAWWKNHQAVCFSQVDGGVKWTGAYTTVVSTTGATVAGTAGAPLSTKKLKANTATKIAASLKPMKARRRRKWW